MGVDTDKSRHRCFSNKSPLKRSPKAIQTTVYSIPFAVSARMIVQVAVDEDGLFVEYDLRVAKRQVLELR